MTFCKRGRLVWGKTAQAQHKDSFSSRGRIEQYAAHILMPKNQCRWRFECTHGFESWLMPTSGRRQKVAVRKNHITHNSKAFVLVRVIEASESRLEGPL